MNGQSSISAFQTQIPQSTSNAIAVGTGLLGILCFVFVLAFFFKKM